MELGPPFTMVHKLFEKSPAIRLCAGMESSRQRQCAVFLKAARWFRYYSVYILTTSQIVQKNYPSKYSPNSIELETSVNHEVLKVKESI